MSRVVALQQWARKSGATLVWAAPFAGETTVAVCCGSGSPVVMASGTDAGQAAERASMMLTTT